jgi:hypothetical protein
MALPKIYCFWHSPEGFPASAYALAEDGVCLVEGFCHSEPEAYYRLGLTTDLQTEPDRAYAKKYPLGYTLEWVPRTQLGTHPGLVAAYHLNQRQKPFSPPPAPSGMSICPTDGVPSAL